MQKHTGTQIQANGKSQQFECRSTQTHKHIHFKNSHTHFHPPRSMFNATSIVGSRVSGRVRAPVENATSIDREQSDVGRVRGNVSDLSFAHRDLCRASDCDFCCCLHRLVSHHCRVVQQQDSCHARALSLYLFRDRSVARVRRMNHVVRVRDCLFATFSPANATSSTLAHVRATFLGLSIGLSHFSGFFPVLSRFRVCFLT